MNNQRIHYREIVFSLVCLFCTGVMGAINHQDQDRKSLFQNEFPKMITMRGEYINYTNSSYTAWSSGNLPSDGVFKKYVSWDEMDRLNTRTQEWASIFSISNPEKLMLLHWDAREHRNDQPGNSDQYFPGHWLSFPGTTLVNPINANVSSLQVEDSQMFARRYPDDNRFMYPILLIVELDQQGNRLWDRYEFVEIIDLDESTHRLSVVRGQALSKPRAFPSGAYVAAMSTRLGRPGLFDYNFSTLCPKQDGKQATDVLLAELLSLFQDGGGLEGLDGIAFDVLQYFPRDPDIDTNNDGIGDGGIIEGVNRFAEGTLNFQKAIREALDERYILLGDSYDQMNQRALHLFNGMESEGLVTHNDAFRGFAKTINVFTFWERNVSSPYKINYFVDKFKNQADLSNADNFRRLTFGTATCLGAAMSRFPGAVVFDEIMGGGLGRQHWLGKPIGEMIRVSRLNPDLLQGSGRVMSRSFTDRVTSSPSSFSVVDNTMVITKDNNHNENSMTVEIHDLNFGTRDEDLVFYFEVIDAGLDGSVLPRTMTAHATGLPSYEESSRNNAMYNDLWGYFGKARSSLISLYYRQGGGRDLSLRLTFEGLGDVKIKNVTAHAGSQLLAREFENGVVLVNPSLNVESFELQQLFPNVELKKIKGLSHPTYNTGETVGTIVEVPALNAMFLLKSNQ